MYENEENLKELTKFLNENSKEFRLKEYSKLEEPLDELFKSFK